jgi:Lrp/AsnC family transcriptional regulator of ectoine degradation
MSNRPRNSKRLDARDLEILEIVQAQGRISKKALADTIGLSLTPCYQRLQRLEKEGYISGYRGVLDAQRFGSFLWICTDITLSRHRAIDFTRFENVVRQIPEVLECDAVGGGIDYVLRLVVRDVSHYQSIIDDLLEKDIGVATYFTYVVTRRVKVAAGIPLVALLGEGPQDARPGAVRAKGK